MTENDGGNNDGNIVREIDVDLEQLEPDANLTVINDHTVAQAVREAQQDYASRQSDHAAHPGEENLITLRIHSW